MRAALVSSSMSNCGVFFATFTHFEDCTITTYESSWSLSFLPGSILVRAHFVLSVPLFLTLLSALPRFWSHAHLSYLLLLPAVPVFWTQLNAVRPSCILLLLNNISLTTVLSLVYTRHCEHSSLTLVIDVFSSFLSLTLTLLRFRNLIKDWQIPLVSAHLFSLLYIADWKFRFYI